MRPLGWWLKQADAQIDAAFDAALRDTGADRRTWQVLTTLGRGPTSRADVVDALTPFDPPAAVERVLEHLQARAWVEESAGALRLTPVGAELEQSLAQLVEGVRRDVAAALPGEDYAALVGLLARLVEALSGRPRPH